MYSILCEIAPELGDKEFTFTINGVVSFILAFCGFVAAIYGCVKIFNEIKKIALKNEDIQDDRINNLEKGLGDIRKEIIDLKNDYQGKYEYAVGAYDELINHYWQARSRHDKEIENMQNGFIVLMRGVQSIEGHLLHGNHTKELTESEEELGVYIRTKMEEAIKNDRDLQNNKNDRPVSISKKSQ